MYNNIFMVSRTAAFMVIYANWCFYAVMHVVCQREPVCIILRLWHQYWWDLHHSHRQWEGEGLEWIECLHRPITRKCITANTRVLWASDLISKKKKKKIRLHAIHFFFMLKYFTKAAVKTGLLTYKMVSKQNSTQTIHPVLIVDS